MKLIIPILGAIIGTTAMAGYVDGNRLLSHLTSEKGQEKLVGLGYLMGAADVADGIFVCAPAKVTVGQMSDLVVAELRNSPETRHQSADMFVIKALRKAWPCQSAPKSQL